MIETWDLQYPPDQGKMAGGYTIMPWISGHTIDLKDPNSLEELKQYIQDPAKYLGLERDCAYGDHSSAFHEKSEGHWPETCYHD